MNNTHAPPSTERESRGDLARRDVPQQDSRVRFGFASKLMVMISVPLAALVLLLGFEVAERLSHQRALQRVVVASALVADAEDVTVALQRERGLSSLYLSSGGSFARGELISQWGRTDAAVADLQSALADIGESRDRRLFVPQYYNVIARLGEVVTMRQQILTLDATWPESLAFYTDLVTHNHDSFRNLARLSRLDADLAALFIGFDHLSEAAEATGIERAVVSKVLVEGSIEVSELDRLKQLAVRQELSLQWYGDHGLFGQAIAQNAHIVEVRRQLENGDLSMDPLLWFDIATAHAEILHATSDEVLAHMAARSVNLANEDRTAMWRFFAFGTLILAASLIIAAAVGRRLSKRIVKLTGVARAIQAGDFTQQLDDRGGDELAVLGVAFTQMTDDLTTLNRTLEDRVEERTAELRSMEVRSRTMLETIPDLIARINSDGVYLDFMHADVGASDGSSVFPPAEEFVGRHIEDALLPKLADELMAAFRRAHDSGETQHLEYRIPIGEDIRDREARVVAIPESDETLVVVRDITERKADEIRLQKLIRSKDELIASISHELRTPLTAVVGFAELLREAESGVSPTEQEAMIESIADQASDISNIVEDLLVAARAEIDTLYVARVPVDLGAQLAQVLEVLRDASVHDVEIVNPPVVALGDPARIRQILRNLLTNAVRHGGDHIQVRIRRDGTMALIQVCDDGPGIAQEDRDAIFDAYERSRITPGLPGSVGLGLTVSRSLARLMEGDVTYRYENTNSIFEVTLPCPPINGSSIDLSR